MTEISEITGRLPAPLERFVVAWGEMGETWGVNRSVAQVHALLFVSERALSADDISERLKMARSNVSTSLKELQGWSLIRKVSVLGDRRDYFEAEADMFEMVRRIAQNRKAREIDPVLSVLEACSRDARADSAVSPDVAKRLDAMLQLTQGVSKSFDEVISLPTPVLGRLIKMGGAVARLVGGISQGKGAKPSKR